MRTLLVFIFAFVVSVSAEEMTDIGKSECFTVSPNTTAALVSFNVFFGNGVYLVGTPIPETDDAQFYIMDERAWEKLFKALTRFADINIKQKSIDKIFSLGGTVGQYIQGEKHYIALTNISYAITIGEESGDPLFFIYGETVSDNETEIYKIALTQEQAIDFTINVLSKQFDETTCE